MNHIRINKISGIYEDIVSIGTITEVKKITIDFALQIKSNFKHSVIYDDDEMMLIRYYV